jgi:endonuclease/exonuclease/phosphatase family metal-dependent hydrolase
VRVASFNVENLFDRARALQLDWEDGRVILERYARINQLLNKPVYSDEDKSEIKELLRALDRFSAQLLKKVQGQPYEHVMVIDGNDERGIDVGVMSRAGYEIASIRSHVDDMDEQGRVFSRDCPEFTVTMPTGERLIVLVNHFKSKGNGRLSVTNALRKRQATRVAEIYRRLLGEGEENIAIVGDLNDTPTSDPLAPLFAAGLKDVSEHPSFSDDGRPGTFKNGTKSQKLDYVLLSPAL